MYGTGVFWPVVLAGLAVLAFAVAGPENGQVWPFAGTFDLHAAATIFASGITIAAAVRILYLGGARTAQFLMLWLGVFGGIYTAFVVRDQIPLIVDRIHIGLNPSVALSRTQGEAELRRGWDGHYRAETEINGIPVRMMIDTGASMVLLPYEQVSEFGINPESLRFSIPVTTANGDSAVAPVRLSSIKVGQIAVFDVHAAVAKPGKLKMGLLGMTFLDKLSETSFQGDRLILRN